MPITNLATATTLDETLLNQALALSPEQKLRLVKEVMQSELNANANEQKQFIETLDATLTELRLAKTPPPAPNGKPPWQKRHAKDMLSLKWAREHRKEYGGQWVALDGSRLIAATTDILELKAAIEADGTHLPLIKFIEPADAPPFLF